MDIEELPNVSLSNKTAFVRPNDDQLSWLENQLLNRLEDGQGECFLELGVGDGQAPGLCAADLEDSVTTLKQLALRLGVTLISLRDRNIAAVGSSRSNQRHQSDGDAASRQPVPPSPDSSVDAALSPREARQKQGQNRRPKSSSISNALSPDASETPQASSPEDAPSPRKSVPTPSSESGVTNAPVSIVREYLLRRDIDDNDFVDVRVSVVGNVDAGKSTLLGVLTHGELDNGRGLARLRLLRHKHEVETGRTSSVSNDILGFNSDGEIVNKPVHGHLDWQHICKAANKVVTFIDLAGHERYLKTTIFGMTGHAPDYAMLMVGANAGMIGMAKEHLGLVLALAVPVFVVVTKIDMCPQNVLQETMGLLFRILKSPGCRKIPLLISSKDDVICSATNFSSERMCPVFTVSNVTGDNLDLLKMFLNLLQPRSLPQLNTPAHFQIDDLFSVPGVGNIVSGTCLRGVIRLNDTLLLGPDPTGHFSMVQIKSIHRKRLPVSFVRGGQTASFALKKIQRHYLRKGLVLVSPELKPRACIEFLAEVLILHHPTTIWVGYQAMVHAGPVRQTATIVELIGNKRLRTGDKDLVRFRFIKYPEYLHAGLRLIFREGKTKAVGSVKEIIPMLDSAVNKPRNRMMKKISAVPPPSTIPPTSSASPASDATSSTTTTTVQPPSETDGASIRQLDSCEVVPNGNIVLETHTSGYSRQRKHYRKRKDQPDALNPEEAS